jgi:serine/threonine-protein kinase RsbT
MASWIEMTATYQAMLKVLSRYLSQVNAKLTLDRALRRVDLTPGAVDERHLPLVIPHLERSLNLFVDKAHLPTLLAELGAGQVDPSSLSDRTITIASEQDLTVVRVEARQVCQDVGASSLNRQKVVTLVSELARNIVLYAGKGRVELSPALQPRKLIVVRASDSGPGIPNLAQILAGDYKSRTGLGMGLRGCKRLANRFEVETGAWGTRVEAEVHV